MPIHPPLAPWAQPAPLTAFISRPEGLLHHITQDGSNLLVRSASTGRRTRWTLHAPAACPTLEWNGPCAGDVDEEALAAIEAAFVICPEATMLRLQAPMSTCSSMWRSGGLLTQGGETWVARELFFQQARMWMPQPAEPFALQYTVTAGQRHPRRAAKPSGLLYERHLPWLGKTWSWRTIDLAHDQPHLQRWMNEAMPTLPGAASAAWADRHSSFQGTMAEPHRLAMMACLDGAPIGCIEVYWAKEGALVPSGQIADFDRGWQGWLGEPACCSPLFTAAWRTCVAHYLFLDDPRTQRVLSGQSASHEQQVHALQAAGYEEMVEGPGAPAAPALLMLQREAFFGEQRWRADGELVARAMTPHDERLPLENEAVRAAGGHKVDDAWPTPEGRWPANKPLRAQMN